MSRALIGLSEHRRAYRSAPALALALSEPAGVSLERMQHRQPDHEIEGRRDDREQQEVDQHDDDEVGAREAREHTASLREPYVNGPARGCCRKGAGRGRPLRDSSWSEHARRPPRAAVTRNFFAIYAGANGQCVGPSFSGAFLAVGRSPFPHIGPDCF